MREIKFRAYIKSIGQVVRVRAIDLENGIVKHEDIDWDFFRDKEIPVKRETLLSNCNLMQYTGLKDKNGKEIYEGDILKVGNFIFTCEWLGKGFGYVSVKDGELLDNKFSDLEIYEKDMEIIGNKYQTPELLKD